MSRLCIKLGPMCFTWSWVWRGCLSSYIWEDKGNKWKITREIRQQSNKSHGCKLGSLESEMGGDL